LRRFAEQLPYRTPPFWQGQLIALISTAAGAGLRFILDPVAHGHISIIVFYPFVLIASIWGGTLAGITALALGAGTASYFWLPAGDNVITLTAFTIICLFGVFMAHLFRALVQLHVDAEARAKLLTRELNHRANNLLGIVQSISAQTARNAASIQEHQILFTQRLTALARAEQLVSERGDAPPDVETFLKRVLEPFGAERFVVDGPASTAPHQIGPSCALLLHELSTNATKYGALSVPDGKVLIRWEQDAQTNQVRLDWRELDGPPVAPPARSGFGSRLLKSAFPPEQGAASVVFDPDGVKCTLYYSLAS
jgi:two-component sensor histidine kinase